MTLSNTPHHKYTTNKKMITKASNTASLEAFNQVFELGKIPQ